MTPRLLILTAGYGEGHNAAARALAEAAHDRFGPQSARVADVFALASPRLNRLSRALYRQLIDRAPGIWSRAYRWVDRSPRVPQLAARLAREQRVLGRLIRDCKPTALCSTYPLYGLLLASLGRRSGPVPPHHVVVTDSISINSLWWRADCRAWFVPNADSAAVLRDRAGISDDRLKVLGFPVSPRFDLPAGSSARLALGTPFSPRVLVLVNSRAPRAAQMARHLLEQDRWAVTIAVSHDDRLRRSLAELAAWRRRPATVLGWTDQIPQLLRSHQLVVSKAGGATTQEALAAGCPMIVNQVIPGQEEGNAELLRRHGIGGRAESPEALDRLLDQAFGDGGRLWRQWHAAAQALARPDAARRIVGHLAGLEHRSDTAPAPSPVFA